MSEELKPCPWCKDKPETQRTVHRLLDGLMLKYWWVQCDNAKCPVMPESLSYNTEAEAIAAWNTRTDEPYQTSVSPSRKVGA